MVLANRGYNSLFDNMFRDPFYGRSQERTETQVMRTDIYEKDGNYLIEMDLPGYSKSDIQADLKEGYLTITAHNNETDEEKKAKGKCIHKERYTGTCSRQFYVGEDLTQEDIKAAFNDGVLKLIVPKEIKKVEEEPKFITIE